MGWDTIKSELKKKIEENIPGAEVYEYSHYLHVKKGDKGARIFLSYGNLRVLDETTRKFLVFPPDKIDDIVDKVKDILK